MDSSQYALAFYRFESLQNAQSCIIFAPSFSIQYQLTNSADLLLQALQAGQISMLEYMMELSIYYDATAQALAAQRDYYTALAELQAVAL